MKSRALVTIGGGYRNVVMATPSIAAVRSLGFEVDALVESRAYGAGTLLSGWDALDTIYLSRASLRHDRGHTRYDAVVRTARNAGQPLGLGTEFSPDPSLSETGHETLRNLSAVRALGYAGDLPPAHVEYDEPTRKLPAQFIAVAPSLGCANGPAEWPHWSDFCALIHERTGLDVLVLGAEDDTRPWMKSLGTPWLHNACGYTSIRAAAGIIQRAKALVAADNALAHIGAALGRPVLAIFSPSAPAANRPLGADVSVVIAQAVCRSCPKKTAPASCSERECMRDATAEKVLVCGGTALGI